MHFAPILHELNMEWYRSGHNGTDSKSVEPQGSVGSNPTRSANKYARKGICTLVVQIPFLMQIFNLKSTVAKPYLYCDGCLLLGISEHVIL